MGLRKLSRRAGKSFQIVKRNKYIFRLFDNPAVLGITTSYVVPAFWVDINGNNGPNLMGKDVFLFMLTDKGLMPTGKENNSPYCSKSSASSYVGMDCANKVLRKVRLPIINV